jgi:L-alanine-DL-glutamate epimerase-like enolase superfamily enzyme
MKRQEFIQHSVAGTVGLLGAGMLSPVLASAVTKLFFVESVYPEWHERNKLFFENPLPVIDGNVVPPDLPGLGLQFKKGLFEQSDVIVEKIAKA